MEWVIGDIHGCLFTLQNIINYINQIDKDRKFIFVGDYIDRGKFSKEVVDFVINLQKEGAICLLGNHDDTWNWIINGSCKGNLKELVCGQVNAETILKWWNHNGLSTCMESYGIDTSKIYSDPNWTLNEIRKIVPQEHKNFFTGLNLIWQNDKAFVAHASIRIDEPLPIRENDIGDESRILETLWTRFDFYTFFNKKNVVWDKIGIFGHTPTNYYGNINMSPFYYEKIRLIDTGCCFPDGKLTAYCIDNDQYLQMDTCPKDRYLPEN